MQATRVHKVNTELYDSFLYVNASGGVTGKTSGDFTIEVSKAGVGNQSTTGITIAEVDSTNNAGEYSITCSTSSFVAATGTYVVTIYETADKDKRWSFTVVVTQTGLLDGSTGDALFTASATDGRVTDGTNPIEGVTVQVQDPSGNTLYQVTTDSDGLYSVYLGVDGTWTLFGQKSGYSQESVTVSVSGSTATGPGADLELSSLTAGTATLSTLLSYARRFAADRSGSKADSMLTDAINDALMQIATSHPWQYLQTSSELDFEAPYSTGTLTLTNGSTTVTGSGTVFPSWAASGEIYVNGGIYRVASRTSDTELELEDAYQLATESGVSYTIVQDQYTLPSDILLLHEFVLGRTAWQDAQRVSYAKLLSMKDATQVGSSWPSYFSIHGNKLSVWPYPSGARDVNLLYYRKPTALSADADNMDFDSTYISLVHRAIEHQIMCYPYLRPGNIDYEQVQSTYEAELKRCMAMDADSTKPSQPLRGDGHYRPVTPLAPNGWV